MKAKLTCYIIDDEHLAQEILEEYVAKVPFLELKGSFMSPLEAAAQLEQDKPDLLFLDINMPDLDGLSFIPMLNPKPMIILTTAYDQYALKAFDLEVKDYLVKPFSFERFYRGVLRLYQEQRDKQPSTAKEAESNPKPEQDFIFLKVGHRIQKVEVGEVLFIEGMKDYLRIHTPQEKIMTLMSFAKLEELLPASKFARTHRSFMVAIEKIDHIEKNRIWIYDQVIPISDSYSESFYNKLKGI
ncbi:LytTR family two component transcriptional regulator [Pontibacter ummariensis]|uniref:Two component transcriptional regulator, LytTR family n=1 Tax=Pontibacter ummariensis TaxID=1610492 RepID=A0A239K0V9_9BACT|nr:LytTR family DNA-binding domain-containing protein [Pontibacter ummariensis]PRY07274.1 LytTR family two component transcriptional regulator [Pontibacter ummariensis]SNT10694.1 two component transcriptional regulator, LytTR family [Pontibacter ummariensis]